MHPLQARRYTARVTSGLANSFSLRLAITASDPPAGSTAADPRLWAARIADARDRARRRLRGTPWRLNADVPATELTRRWQPGPRALAGVSRAIDLGQIRVPAASQVIRLAWTLTDLAGKQAPGPGECDQALACHLGISA